MHETDYARISSARAAMKNQEDAARLAAMTRYRNSNAAQYVALAQKRRRNNRMLSTAMLIGLFAALVISARVAQHLA